MRLHVAEAGEGPLVLLLHGFPEFWWTWRAQLPALAAAGFLIVTGFLGFVALLVAFVGYRMVKKIEKPERTMESLRELPEVMRREAPGQRRRDLPVVAHGQVTRRDPDAYLV